MNKPHPILLRTQIVLQQAGAAVILILVFGPAVTQFSQHWYLATLLAAGQAVTDQLPFAVISSGNRADFTASTVIVISTVSLLPPQLGILVIVVGTAAQLITNWNDKKLGVNNTANAIVGTSVAYAVVLILGGPSFSPRGFVNVVVAASAGEFVSLVLVGFNVAFEGRVKFWNFISTGVVTTAVPWPWLTSVGILISAIGFKISWALPLTVAPLTLILLASRSRVQAVEERSRLDSLLVATTVILHADSISAVTKAAAEGAATLFEGKVGRIEADPAGPGELSSALTTARFGNQYLLVGERSTLRQSYSARDQRLLDTLASVTATALDKAALHEDVSAQATTDALTGLCNRRSFEEQVRVAVDGMRSSDGTGIIFVDLDRFKQINDVHGHQAGDEVLIEAASRLSAAVRSGDLVARLGGDEFTFLLRGVRVPDDAIMVAERVLTLMRKPITLSTGVEVSTTPSVGIALALQPGSDPVQLLKDADAAMYEAKRAGKDCWRLAANDVAAVS